MSREQRQAAVLLVEDTPAMAEAYLSILRKGGLEADLVETGEAALEALAHGSYRVVLLDIELPGIDGFAVLRQMRDSGTTATAIVITVHGSVSKAVEAMRLGARDFIVKPFTGQRLLTTTRNMLDHATLRETVETLRDDFGRDRYYGFIGRSLAMQAVYRTIDSVARSRAGVFITGESGTGKEVCAQAIHRAGPRRDGPFVPLNCGAIPKDLIESEMFGHLKGAFTGATSDRVGAAALADGGTLFLDEICEMDIALQAKLLRFLQSGQIQRVGSPKLEPVDVRIVCATNRDPWYEVSEGRFREDLFYRLHVVPIHLPPLRDRDEDVLDIATDLLRRYSAEEGRSFDRFAPAAADVLMAHPWPGNVRELQNVVRQIVVLHDSEEVTPEMLPPPLGRASDPTPSAAPPPGRAPPLSAPPPDPGAGAASATQIAIGRPLREIEKEAIEGTIRLCGGNIPRAARMLGISPSTIYRKKEAWLAEGLSPGPADGP